MIKEKPFKGIITVFGIVPPPMEFDYLFGDGGSPHTATFVGFNFIETSMKLINIEHLQERKSILIFKKISTLKQKTLGDLEILKYSDYAVVYLHNSKKFVLIKTDEPAKMGNKYDAIKLI